MTSTVSPSPQTTDYEPTPTLSGLRVYRPIVMVGSGGTGEREGAGGVGGDEREGEGGKIGGGWRGRRFKKFPA